jgi:hypothetical protein
MWARMLHDSTYLTGFMSYHFQRLSAFPYRAPKAGTLLLYDVVISMASETMDGVASVYHKVPHYNSFNVLLP